MFVNVAFLLCLFSASYTLQGRVYVHISARQCLGSLCLGHSGTRSKNSFDFITTLTWPPYSLVIRLSDVGRMGYFSKQNYCDTVFLVQSINSEVWLWDTERLYTFILQGDRVWAAVYWPTVIQPDYSCYYMSNEGVLDGVTNLRGSSYCTTRVEQLRSMILKTSAVAPDVRPSVNKSLSELQPPYAVIDASILLWILMLGALSSTPPLR